MTTLTPEHIHPFPPTMQDLERKVADLESKVADLEHDRDYWRGQSNNRQAQIDALEMYVKENFDYIDEDVSQNLVEIFSLEITKDYDVTVTVTFSGTVSVPLNYDMDSLENDLSAGLESHYYSADVEADFSEDRMEIDWSES
jgi:outer membrane murein-binding lipoprotein Lpp